MKLISTLISKELELFNEFMVGKKYKRASNFFFGSDNMAIAALEMEDTQKRFKNKLLKKSVNGKFSEKQFIKLKEVFKNEMTTISKAMEFIENETMKMQDVGGGIYQEGRGFIGILSFELQN